MASNELQVPSALRSQAADMILQVITTRIAPESRQQVRVFARVVESVIETVTTLFQNEPPVMQLAGEYCIVGDIHGNVDSLIRIFEKKGYPPQTRYLFLGDYVDRGRHSCEVLLLLYSLKIMFPDQIRLLRGNHEFPLMCELYGFKRECETRLSYQMYSMIMQSFDELPIAAIIGQNFCVHGGISPLLKSADDIMSIAKIKGERPLGENMMSDLVWSDPCARVAEFEKSPRGCGVLFGAEAVNKFTKECGIVSRIIRSHESCADGFEWPFSENGPVLTVFSSCNYCETMNNAAVAMISDSSDSTECTILRPLDDEIKSRRRVQFPIWLVDAPNEGMKGVDLSPDISEALAAVIEV
jgi:diadenosine tetraphosphatase ApaH/serine/threonine PP2A family protein phosphatase